MERSKHAFPQEANYAARQAPATYVIFDILEKEGRPLTNLPLVERKRILKDCVTEGKHTILSEYVEGQGEVYYEAAVERGIEGIMAKKKTSTYQPGLRSSDWLKIKKVNSCDCVIFGYTVGEGKRRETFGALILGLYDKNEPVYVGKVGTGFSDREMESLMKEFQDLKATEKTLEGVETQEKVAWLKPKLVCEVTYQTVTRDGKLRISNYRGLRADKKASECTLDQLRKSKLQEYLSKRNFSVTSEPRSSQNEKVGHSFVVQEHHARRLHYDLRLEKDGVLKSWAVPKGIPEEIGKRRLAVAVEDHPLDYGKFEGTIPKGEYGAGNVRIWDKGSFQIKAWLENKIEFIVCGERLHGRYVLARFKKAGENQWLLLKARDDDE
jgi:DNA ligase D-like protein (predicted 3'-phosphoesterase)